ncbi:hypothetical protein MTO96_023452 [Rhipicephalus appendiculatus]
MLRDTSTAGHPGYAKTYARISERFWWRNLQADSLALNCSTICDAQLNDTMPCVNATSPPLNFSIPQNYTCTVGSCHGGVCLSNKTQNVSCWADGSESEGDELSERADFIELY